MSSPIVVGAVGGSGTRIVAQILSNAGIYIGQELNKTNDNLWFTFFLKRPSWMAQCPNPTDVTRALTLFARASTTGLHSTLTLADAELIEQIAQEQATSPRPMGIAHGCAQRIMASSPAPLGSASLWGWKEPNSHIFLPQLAQTFPDLKYIHVIRNGFDMAYSANTQQARNWSLTVTGRLIQGKEISPQQVLEYWIAANKRALSYGRAHLGDRFHVINYEELCRAPHETLHQLFDFLKCPTPANKFANLIQPSSQGRHKLHDPNTFSATQKTAVHALMKAA